VTETGTASATGTAKGSGDEASRIRSLKPWLALIAAGVTADWHAIVFTRIATRSKGSNIPGVSFMDHTSLSMHSFSPPRFHHSILRGNRIVGRTYGRIITRHTRPTPNTSSFVVLTIAAVVSDRRTGTTRLVIRLSRGVPTKTLPTLSFCAERHHAVSRLVGRIHVLIFFGGDFYMSTTVVPHS
jgi:hypothetical protein